VILAAFAVVSISVVRILGFPNPWVVGSLIVGIGAAVTGFLVIVPRPLLVVAQVVIGIALGCRFQRSLLVRLPTVTMAGLAIAALLIAAAAAGAVLLSYATGLPVATSFLAIAPAGVTEMVLTATVMHLDAALVTTFHVVRLCMVAMTILLMFRLFDGISKQLRIPEVRKP
jgi:membrane AbrB-like protein